MGTTSNPGGTFILLPAGQEQTIKGRRDLICGQTGVSGAAVSGELNENVQDLTDAQIRVLFGADSYLTSIILNFRSGNDRNSQLDVIAVDAAGGAVFGTSTIQTAGTATADGTLTIALVDEIFEYDVAVSSGDLHTAVAVAINAGVATLTNPLFSSAVVTDTVTYTALDGGTPPNKYGIRVTGNVPGITAIPTAWTGGLTDPTLTTILDAITGIRYNGILWPEAWYSDIDIPKDHLDDLFNAVNAIMDGVCFTGKTETFATSKAAALTQNSQSLVLWGNNLKAETLDKGPAILQPADWSVAYFMGVRSKRLTAGSIVAGDITSIAPLDAIGNIGNGSLPYFNTPLKDVPITNPTFLFDQTEQTELIESGFSTFGVNDAINNMISGQIVTTWTTDPAGNPNTSFLYLNYVDTGSLCREFFFNNYKADFAQARLVEGDLVANKSFANAGFIKSSFIEYYKSLADIGLTQKGVDPETGVDATAFFSKNLTITVDMQAGTATAFGPLPIVTQLRGLTYALSLSFSINR
jgi:phage tail sheath gpL-like